MPGLVSYRVFFGFWLLLLCYHLMSALAVGLVSGSRLSCYWVALSFLWCCFGWFGNRWNYYCYCYTLCLVYSHLVGGSLGSVGVFVGVVVGVGTVVCDIHLA